MIFAAATEKKKFGLVYIKRGLVKRLECWNFGHCYVGQCCCNVGHCNVGQCCRNIGHCNVARSVIQYRTVVALVGEHFGYLEKVVVTRAGRLREFSDHPPVDTYGNSQHAKGMTNIVSDTIVGSSAAP